MNRKRRRKRSFQKARDKVEKREEELNQDMAIRGIANRAKKEQKEEKKNKAPSVESLDSASNTNPANKPSQQNENTLSNNSDTTTIPEVFDSSKYDSMTEMKESADMKEGEGHLKEVLSSVKKETPIEPTTTNTKLSNMDSSPSTAEGSTPDISPPNLEERESTLRNSREEQIADRHLEVSKDKSKEEEEEEVRVKDKKAYSRQDYSSNIAGSYTSFWQDVAKSWNDFYIEYARNASEITKYWLDLFSKSWLFGYKKRNNQ
jgi:hypothetical protein